MVAAAQIPDDLGLGDPLAAGLFGHAIPGKARIGELVPAREIHRLERPSECRSQMVLGTELALRTSSCLSLNLTTHIILPPRSGTGRPER